MSIMSSNNINPILSEDESKLLSSKKLDTREIKKEIRLEQRTSGVVAFVVAVHNDLDKNRILEVPAEKGKPLSYEAYDIVRDCYHVLGQSFHIIGKIPVNYVAYFKEVAWEMDVPLPLSILRRHMNEYQKKAHDNWLSKYEKTNYEIRYFQMLSVN